MKSDSPPIDWAAVHLESRLGRLAPLLGTLPRARWTERDPKDGETFMRVGKFRRILGQVDAKVRLNADARLTFKVSRPGEAMRVYDVADLRFTEDSAIVRLGERSAICKPRHRAALAIEAGASACCTPGSANVASACC